MSLGISAQERSLGNYPAASHNVTTITIILTIILITIIIAIVFFITIIITIIIIIATIAICRLRAPQQGPSTYEQIIRYLFNTPLPQAQKMFGSGTLQEVCLGEAQKKGKDYGKKLLTSRDSHNETVIVRGLWIQKRDWIGITRACRVYPAHGSFSRNGLEGNKDVGTFLQKCRCLG